MNIKGYKTQLTKICRKINFFCKNIALKCFYSIVANPTLTSTPKPRYCNICTVSEKHDRQMHAITKKIIAKMSKVLTKVIQITMRCNRSPLCQNSVGLCEVQCRIYVVNRWKCYPDYFADPLALHSCRRVHACIIQTHTSPETSQVTYVTMVPPSGEQDTASPRGGYGGNAVSVTRAWSIYIYKNTSCWPATAYDVNTDATTI